MNKQDLQKRKQELENQISEIKREISNSLPGKEGDRLRKKEALERELPEIQKQLDFLEDFDFNLLLQYAKALITRYQNISFLGIPDLRDKKEIPLDSIFVELECVRFYDGFSEKRKSIAQMMKKFQKLVILGDPGAGKSTLLKYQTLENAKTLEQIEGKLSQGTIP